MGWRELAFTDDPIATLSSTTPEDIDPTEAYGIGGDASKDDHTHKVGTGSVTGSLEMSSGAVQVADDTITLAKKATSGWIVSNEGLQEDGGTHALEVDLSGATLEISANVIAVIANSITAAKVDSAAIDIAFDEIVLDSGSAPTELKGAVYADSSTHAIMVCTASA